MVWAARPPQAANEAFNITNGDMSGGVCGRPLLKPSMSKRRADCNRYRQRPPGDTIVDIAPRTDRAAYAISLITRFELMACVLRYSSCDNRRQQPMKRTSAKLILLAGLGFICGMVPHALADEWDQKTIVNFNGPVEVPGRVLPAGTYVFKLADSSSDRNIGAGIRQE